jgi:hypothetical protein
MKNESKRIASMSAAVGSKESGFSMIHCDNNVGSKQKKLISIYMAQIYLESCENNFCKVNRDYWTIGECGRVEE